MALTSEGKLYGWGWNKANGPVPLFVSLDYYFFNLIYLHILQLFVP
jgi:hypothetical protein